MSVRELYFRVFQTLWRGVRQRDTVGGAKAQERGFRTLEIEAPGGGRAQVNKQTEAKWVKTERRKSLAGQCGGEQTAGLGRGQYSFASVRRTLVDNVLRRVTNSQAAILRRKAAHQLTSLGNSAPFLALVGVSLASGSGILTKEDEIEGVCSEIRQAVGKTSLLSSNLMVKNKIAATAAEEAEQVEASHAFSLQDFDLGKPLAKGCSAVVYAAKLRKAADETVRVDEKRTEQHNKREEEEFPFAIKMMFNYHAESNAFTILRAMQREIVPARSVSLPAELRGSLAGQLGEVRHVPAHPNIVELATVFADQVPGLPGDRQLYGDALPARLNPGGYGRNMSLFLVMRRYDSSLRDYLDQYRDQLSARTSLILFTQLLEGVAFLGSVGVAHRDLKSDNLLVDLSGGLDYPRLVISDFGCCLADRNLGLRLPYRTYDTDKGGNAALMAPEVALAVPGTFTTITYTKSDLWTAGSIAYEIFGAENPFYSTQRGGKCLDSRTYTQADLPELPGHVPPLVRELVAALLSRQPDQRPSPRQAATICQLLLWAPSHWYRQPARTNRQQILQWLLTMTTKVLCESRWGNSQSALQEYQLVATFLATLSLQDIMVALDWIQDKLELED